MYKRALTVFFLVLIALTFLIAAPAPAGATEPLRVLTVFPTGEAPRVKQVTITFNQPMVALGDMSREPSAVPVTIKPAMKGSFRWLNVYTLAFEPETPLEGSVEGTITVRAGAKALSGGTLAKNHQVRFSLPRIRLINSTPGAGTMGLDTKTEITLRFNQPLDIAKLASLAYFQTQSGKRYPLTAKIDNKANEDRLPGGDWRCLVAPVNPLPRGSNFELIVPAGLKSQVGPLPGDKAYRYPFSTYGALRIAEITGYKPEDQVEFDPESGLEIRFTNPVDLRDLVKNLKITPEYNLERLDVDSEWERVTSSVWLPGPFNPKTTYRFSFNRGLKDKYGQPLEGRATWQVAIGDARPVLDLNGRQGVLEDSGEPKYPYQVRNIDKVQLRAVFLAPDEAVPFVVQHKLHRYLYESEKDTLAGYPANRVKYQTIDVNLPLNRMVDLPIKPLELFGPDSGPGLIYFDLNATETNNQKTGAAIYRRAVVQVTGVGLSAKFGQTNTLIWTTELATGKPLPKVRVEIRGWDNQVLWRGLTDEEGLAFAPGARELSGNLDEGAKQGAPAFFVSAIHNGRMSLITNEWVQGIAPWNFGLAARELDQGGSSKIWTLTSLPMYKPGEEVHFKVIQRVEMAEGLRPPRQRKVKITIRDSRGKTIQTSDLKLSGFGTASDSFKLPPDAALGSYGIMLTADRQSHYAGGFQVETYRKPTFALTVKPDKDSAVVGDEVVTDLSAVYHFGAPVKNRPAEYTASVSSAYYELPRFESYNIQDYINGADEYEEPVEPLARGKVDLDAAGKAQFSFKATAPKKPEPRNVIVEATVTDVDQRTVSQRQTVLVHPASFYIGLKSDQYVVSAGEKIKVHLIAADPKGQVVQGKTAELSLYRRTWQTVRRKGVGGYYEYISEPKDELVESHEVISEADPKELVFSVERGGYYYLSAKSKDEAGRPIATAVDFYAYGGGPSGWEHYDHDRIDLIPDKKEYKPGETAKLLVKSPFTSGTGLLTVEREGVRRHRLFEINGSAPTLEVKLDETDGPNVFVSVLLVRGRISEELDKQGKDPGKPAFKVGYAELTVKDDSHRLNVALSMDKEKARPGEEVEVSVRVTDSAGAPQKVELALIAADAAVLQLSSENVYYPERLFFAPRELSVWSADTRLNLIGRRHYGLKGAKAGGGGFGEGGDRFRSKFVSMALWEPHLITDSDGRATVKFKLPDNLTTFKVFAVAASETDKFGTGVSPIVVAKPLLIKPALPNFAGLGDTFKASVVVHNLTDTTGQAEVTLSGERFQIDGPATKKVDLKGGESREIGFAVKVEPGADAVFRFKASMADDTDAAQFTIPIRYPNPMVTAGTYDRITESKSLSVKLPAAADPNRGELSLTVSPSLAGSFLPSVDYLVKYPHNCLEQKMSRAWGDLIFLGLNKRFDVERKELETARDRIIKLLGELSSYQRYSGGFTFWPGGQYEDPYLSAYVLQYLHFATNAKAPVDQEVKKRAANYLFGVLKNDKFPTWYSKRERLAARTFITSVLAEAGYKVDALVENLYSQRQEMGSYELALLLRSVVREPRTEYMAKQVKDLSNRLFARAVITSGEVHFEEKEHYGGLMSSRTRTNAYALRALLWSQPDSPHLTPLARWLAQSRRDGHWGSTQANATALLAMVEYVDKMEKEKPNFSLQALLGDKEMFKVIFHDFDEKVQTRTIPNRELPTGEKAPLRLEYKGQGSAYYTMRLSYAPKQPDLTPYQAGLTLDRSYSIMGGDEKAGATEFKRGDVVKVTVTMLVPNQRHWVVLEDWLPAGLEPINFNLAAAPQGLQSLLSVNSLSNDWYTRYWYQHREIWPDHVSIYARTLREGVYTFSYLARAVTPGRFIAPGSTAEEMYSPETSGRGAGYWIEVR